ncbi:hypothetical protein LTR84_012226 [Exophiala bonariae]|uniref:NACHT domain-containing protein n=1 Tax=Exophiala bonariae TaxID=1690606 RepID=A0AAV9NFL1_9EURO|nr:hypothetical protein LTR84_012226 [Exophiala bonariae]
MSDQSRLAISAAFKKLETAIYPADARLFCSTTLKDVQEAAKVVQRDQEARQCIRNLRRIKPLFAALERLGTAVETLCQGTPYLCFIWAPLKLILTIGNEYISGFEKLVDAYGQIARHLPRLDRLSRDCDQENRFDEYNTKRKEGEQQLLQFHAPTPDHPILRLKTELIPFVYEEVAKGSNPTLARLRSLFRALLGSLDLVYLVVDGLDECDRNAQKETLQELLDVPITDTSSQHYRLKILFCSRETEEIIRKLRKKPFISLSVEQESLSRDISAYTKARLSNLRGDYENGLVDGLEQHIISKSQGMFLWAKLVVDLAFEQRSVRDLQNVVLQTSPGLDGIYASILERLNHYTSEQLRKVNSILGWIAFAFRPLKTFEVCDALVFEDDDSTLDSTTKLLKSVLDTSKPLIEEKDDQTVVLVHFSAREYLLSKRSGPYLPAWSTNARITASSLRYLSTCAVFLANHDGHDAKFQVLKGFHDLFPYVHEFWIQHCFAVTSRPPTSITDKQLFLALHQLLLNLASHWAVRTGTSSHDTQQSTFHIPLYANSDEIEEVVFTISAAVSHATDLPTAQVSFRKRYADLDPRTPMLYPGSTQAASDQHASTYRKLWEAFRCFQHNFEQLFESSKNDVLIELNQFGIKGLRP